MSLIELASLLRSDLLRLTLSTNQLHPNKPNWLRIFHPRFVPVFLIRIARYFYLNPLLKFLSPVFTWLNLFIFGIEFSARCDVGVGLFIPHTVGTVIGATKIGRNATIFQGVTLGALAADMSYIESMRPSLGNDVIVGAGAKLLGGISIGNNVTIGANSVVLSSLPDNVVAVGVPAKIVKVISSSTST